MSVPQIARLIDDPSKIKDLFIPIPITIGTFRIDVLQIEVAEREWELTRRPIEQGATLADHRIQMPLRLHLEGILGDQSLQAAQVVSELYRNEGGFDLTTWQEKEDQLITVCEADDLYEVITPHDTYDQMSVTYFLITRDRLRANACFFAIDLEEVRFVASEVASVDPDALPVRQKKKKDKRRKNPTKKEKRQSKTKDQGTKQLDKSKPRSKSTLLTLFGG